MTEIFRNDCKNADQKNLCFISVNYFLASILLTINPYDFYKSI